MKRRLVVWAPLGIGLALFVVTLTRIDLRSLAEVSTRLGFAIPVVILINGLSQAVRTQAWQWCFPLGARLPFRHLLRVRLAAEAFSYVTFSGIAGEPLKVVLLRDSVSAASATAAVILERVTYSIVTMALVGLWAGVVLATVPLSPHWRDVFGWLTFMAAVLVVLIAGAIAGDGTYTSRSLQKLSRATGGLLGGHALGRFLVRAEQHILEFARADRGRVVRIIGADTVNYLLMGTEVWVVLKALGFPPSFATALTIETFTRVMSVAASPIPGSLGVLEASHLAVASAVGVGGAGAALAIARRVRGLFWAGVGFAIYLRRASTDPLGAPTSHADEGSLRSRGSDPFERSLLVYLVDEPSNTVSPAARIGGLPMAERVLRSAARAGYRAVIAWAPESGRTLKRIADRIGSGAPAVAVARTEAEWSDYVGSGSNRPLTVIGPGTIVAPALLDRARQWDSIGEIPAGRDWPASGVFRLELDALLSPARAFAAVQETQISPDAMPPGEAVSKGEAMLTLRVRHDADLPVAERVLRRSVFKPTDPFLARFNRRLSLPISMKLIRTPVTANQISVSLVALGFLAAWLFTRGTYLAGVYAAAISLAASILDGCDGEIARLKYQESAFGCWVETFGDYSYYIAIFAGLTIGAVRSTGSPIFVQIGGVALAGALITFALLILLRQRITGERPERLQATAKAHFYATGKRWAWLVAKISVCGTRSTMPYGIMAFALIGQLPVIVVLAAVGANIYWISLALRLRALLAPVTQNVVVPAGES